MNKLKIAFLKLLVLAILVSTALTAVSAQNITEGDVIESALIAENLKFDEQLHLPINWHIYSASLNWSDYESHVIPPAIPIQFSDMNKPF